MRACSFDLETTGLNADFGVILCACIKPFGGRADETKTFRRDRYPNWKTQRSNDKALCRDIFKELKKYDIWIAHNGVNFDKPFLTSRMLKYGLVCPQMKLVDPVKLARRHLRLSYNSLEKVAGFLGIHGKTRVEGKYWMRAALDGCTKSMDYIVEHCVADVDILEKVADKLRPFVSKINSWGSDS